MDKSGYNISIHKNISGKEKIQEIVEEFSNLCKPYEKKLYLLIDASTFAIYCECHIHAKELLELSTIDVPLDPEDQPEYRANRDIMEDHVAFEQMKSDAKNRRTFSNIVAEFDLEHDSAHPIKIIGGQHRYEAIKEAYENGVAEYHGLKIYFDLDKEQRLDVQLISNVNIAVSTDLYDRLQETSTGPELRNWCQEVGFLDPGEDFSAKRQRRNPITVRAVRSFIMNYSLGKLIDPEEFETVDTTAVICQTGKTDQRWEELRKDKSIWEDSDLKMAAKEFMLLDEAQRSAIERMSDVSSNYAEKATNFSIMTAWAYVAGILQHNEIRLKRHYNLRTQTKKDPLNAKAMADGRHKSDPENYRGLGTRSNPKERGRCVELFYLQAEKDKGITENIVDVAIKRYHIKQSSIELREAEDRI
jgi:hypothetical protein